MSGFISAKMGVIGFDFCNESGVVAVAEQRGTDVVLSYESKRDAPAILCTSEKQRLTEIAGAATTPMDPKNSVSLIKRLIGLRFSNPELQRDIKALPFSVIEGPDGYPLIQMQYVGKVRSTTPIQVLGRVLSDLKTIVQKNLNTTVVDCCIGIPIYFTDPQRRAVMDAARLAGLHPLQLFHETTATALAYGINNIDLPESDQINVAFIDIGHASMQVCIAGFKKGQLKVLAHAFDQSLGGRDFDKALFQHFVTKFKEEKKMQNVQACLRLRTACKKLKEMLTANSEAPLNIESLMLEKDIRGFINRDEFEQISIPILERVKEPLERALSEAGLTIMNIHSVEVAGSVSCVPAVIRILTEFFQKEPRCTMNASAQGCAYQCAMLSPTFKVRRFQVSESFPYSIALSWKGSAPDSENGAADHQQSTIVFPKGNPLPSIKALTFYRSETFAIDVQYADTSEMKAPLKISTYMVGPFQSKKGERAKLEVKVSLNIHGIFSIYSATLMEEEEVEVTVTKMDIDDAPTQASQMAALLVKIFAQVQAKEVIENGKGKGKRSSESESQSVFSKRKKGQPRKHIVGAAKRNIMVALKGMGLEVGNLYYLDDVNLESLRDLVLAMSWRVKSSPPVAPIPVGATQSAIVWNNQTISELIQRHVKNIQGAVRCKACGATSTLQVDWREGFLSLASYILGNLFSVSPKFRPPINWKFEVPCLCCPSNAVPIPSISDTVVRWDWLFLALTHSICVVPKETVVEYVQGQNFYLSSKSSYDDILLKFYISILIQLDPENGWNLMSARV